MNANTVRQMLKRAKGRQTLRQFAEAWNMDHAYLYRMIEGDREPSIEVLTKLGLEKVTSYRTIKSNGIR